VRWVGRLELESREAVIILCAKANMIGCRPGVFVAFVLLEVVVEYAGHSRWEPTGDWSGKSSFPGNNGG
jgi:hypothetical protein